MRVPVEHLDRTEYMPKDFERKLPKSGNKNPRLSPGGTQNVEQAPNY